MLLHCLCSLEKEVGYDDGRWYDLYGGCMHITSSVSGNKAASDPFPAGVVTCHHMYLQAITLCCCSSHGLLVDGVNMANSSCA
jgi:hypothetical protein